MEAGGLAIGVLVGGCGVLVAGEDGGALTA